MHPWAAVHPVRCTAASAYKQRDSVRRRRLLTTMAPKPPPHPRKLQRSGKRSAHQPPGHGCTYKSAWYPVQCAATMPDAAQAGSWQGSCERGGLGAPFAFNQRHLRSKCTGRTLAAGRPLPLAASFFLYSFFAGEERMEPPEGAGPFAWWIFRRKDFQIELFRLKQ